MKTIIAPTDFSEVSLNAVNYAADMAAHLDAKLLLFHVATITTSAVPEFPISNVTFLNPNSERQLFELQARILKRTNNAIVVETEYVVGNVSYELKDVCSRVNPFAIVMATNSYSLVDRLLFGSTTIYSVTHLPFPVLVVPAKAIYKAVKKIGYATDLRGIYSVPLEELKTIMNAFDASLHVVHVDTGNEDASISATEKTLLQYRLKEFNISYCVIKDQSVDKGLERFADDNSIDLMLLMPKKHGFLHKSRCKQAMLHLAVPSMTIHEE